jgi:hypothetical protein
MCPDRTGWAANKRIQPTLAFARRGRSARPFSEYVALSEERPVFLNFGTIEFAPGQRADFREGRLRRRWHRTYPQLFDSHDLTLAEHQCNYHFYEWLAAVVLYHATGYHCLMGKYQFANHPRKRDVTAKLLAPAVLELLDGRKEWGRTQGPDLLMYAPDFSDWFFCEAKGPRDSLSERQRGLFAALAQASGRAIGLLEFRTLRRGKG